jgi:hypothetical protein
MCSSATHIITKHSHALLDDTRLAYSEALPAEDSHAQDLTTLARQAW